LVKTGVLEVFDHVKTRPKNWDLTYVQDKTTESVSFYDKILKDIDALSKNQTVTVCDVTCPNSIWVYDAVKCSCACKVTDCPEAQTAIDYYNCQCAPLNGCQLTQQDCESQSGKILDYAKCSCKEKPPGPA
jgi:hypothetical protein